MSRFVTSSLDDFSFVDDEGKRIPGLFGEDRESPEGSAATRQYSLSLTPPDFGGPDEVHAAFADEVRKLARRASAALHAALGRSADPHGVARAWAAEWTPKLASLLADARLAGELHGMRDLAGRFQGGVEPPDWEADADLPMVKHAASHLASMKLLGLPDYLKGRQEAEMAASEAAHDQTERVREALHRAVSDGGTLKDFRREAAGALDPAHAEVVFRDNVMAAYSAGQEKLLADPDVGGLFPYRQYVATHDTRVRSEHLALETAGIGGTSVYRADDPVWDAIRPPKSHNCRCTWIALTVAQAARLGVPEAKRWLESGIAPTSIKAWVAMPKLHVDPDFAEGRELSALTPADDPDEAFAVELATEWELATDRQAGEVWRGQSGRWFTKRNDGRVVPAKAPGGSVAAKSARPAKQSAAAKPAKAAKPPKATVESVRDGIAAMRSQEAPPGVGQIAVLFKSLMGLTVPQLNELKKSLNLKASGPKAELANKIAERALAGGKAEAPKKEEPKPELEPEPKAEPKEEPTPEPKKAGGGALASFASTAPEAKRKQYAAGLGEATASMPPKAIERVAKSLKGIDWYESAAEIGPAMIDASLKGASPELAEHLKEIRGRFERGEMVAGGAYTPATGRAWLDGDATMPAGDDGRHGHSGKVPAASIYAHELGHAIDRGEDGTPLSRSGEWMDAFEGEISHHDYAAGRAKEGPPPLSRYAATSAEEGFAEFARLVYASDVPHAQIREEFPRAVDFFRGQGLWPEKERTGGESQMPEAFDLRIPVSDDGSHIDARRGRKRGQ